MEQGPKIAMDFLQNSSLGIETFRCGNIFEDVPDTGGRDHQEASGSDSEGEMFVDIPLNSPPIFDDQTDNSNEENAVSSQEPSNEDAVNSECNQENAVSSQEPSNEDAVNSECNQNPESNAGVTCTGCNRQPKTFLIFFTAERSNDCKNCIRVYCSQECADNGISGHQEVISVNLWDTDSSSLKKCLCCHEFNSMPITVCLACQAYMCGNCSRSSKVINGRFRCSLPCNSEINTVVLPRCIANPARLEKVDLASPLLPEFMSSELVDVSDNNYTWHVLHPQNQIPGNERQRNLYIERLLEDQEVNLHIEEQERQHRIRQLDDENRRLQEANDLQDLSRPAEFQRSRLLVENDGPQERDIANGTRAELAREEVAVPLQGESSSVSEEMVGLLTDESNFSEFDTWIPSSDLNSANNGLHTASDPPTQEFYPPTVEQDIEEDPSRQLVIQAAPEG